MSIAKGSTWGAPGLLPIGATVVATNRGLSEVVANDPLDGSLIVGLTGGDLFRAVGGASVADRLYTDDAMRLPIDVIEATLDDKRTIRFVAHLIAHNRMWTYGVAAMNADFWRKFQLGPRSHPGDGVIDVYRAELKLADITRIAPRAKTGTHVPHPRLILQRSPTATIDFSHQLKVVADDIVCGRARHIDFRVIPDAITVVV